MHCVYSNEACVSTSQHIDVKTKTFIWKKHTQKYCRRQNLEFESIPVTENEDVVDSIVQVGNLVGAKIKRSGISIAHRLPPKRYSKVGDPLGIIARFESRNIRNEIYSKNAVVKNVDAKIFPAQKMERKNLSTKI